MAKMDAVLAVHKAYLALPPHQQVAAVEYIARCSPSTGRALRARSWIACCMVRLYAAGVPCT